MFNSPYLSRSMTFFPLLFLCGCIHAPRDHPASESLHTEGRYPAAVSGTETGQQTDTQMTAGTDTTARRNRQQIMEIGSGEFITASPARPQSILTAEDGDITLNFEDTDLREFLKAVLGDVLNKNYLLDPAIGGRVSITTSRPVTRDELLPMLENILAMNNAALIETDGLYQVVPRARAGRGHRVPATAPVGRGSGYAIRILPLQYIAAHEMQKILEPMVREGSDLRFDRKRNLVIVSGTLQELNIIEETVEIFDVDWLRGMSVGLYPLEHVSPAALKRELESIAGAMAADEGRELLGGLVRIVTLDRLNSILLISSTPAALREIELWIYRLDREGEHAVQRLYVYRIQNAKATDLGEILGHIFNTGSLFTTPAIQRRGVSLAPGLSPVEIHGQDEPEQSVARSATTPAPSSETGISVPAGAINIIADDVRNALVVLASPHDYRMVESAIRKLDVVPLQVLIEASIIEVSLRDDLSYGVEWFFKNTIRGRESRGLLDLGETGLNPLTGFSYTILNSAEQVRAAINALEQASEVNVLSSPSLMVLDNQTAFINVGDEIPVPSRQSISNIDPASPTVNEIQFRQTGVTLTVTPRVNNSGLVTMEIRQEVSNAVTTTTSNIDAPTIQQRQVESTVAISSGETIMLGGLIQDTNSQSKSGVPVLQRIPVLGKLFGQTRNESRRTELLVLLTPRVVRNRDDARGITEEYRQRLRGLQYLPEPIPGS